MNPILNKIDPYWGSVWAFVESLSNYVAVGGDPQNVSIINNYIWPFPDAESMWSLDKSVDAVCDCMDIFKAPVISGKDSLSSTFKSKDGKVIKIPPVLCISAFGKIKNVEKTVSSDFKKINSSIYLVGKLDYELGGSTYYDINRLLGSKIPKVDLKNLPKLFKTLYKSIVSGNILSCHDISEGGVISCLAEMCFGGDCGVDLKILNRFSPENFLFNETAGTFIVEVKDEKAFKMAFKNLPIKKLGKTIKQKNINLKYNFKKLFSLEVDELKNAWQAPIRRIFQ
jgi:phosphoribosylformylglycinamidine synthase subunit PurSL